ncbi:MAG: hypothetical protein V1851_02225 [Patescibacteria group bacterium]
MIKDWSNQWICFICRAKMEIDRESFPQELWVCPNINDGFHFGFEKGPFYVQNFEKVHSCGGIMKLVKIYSPWAHIRCEDCGEDDFVQCDGVSMRSPVTLHNAPGKTFKLGGCRCQQILGRERILITYKTLAG